MTPIWAMVGSLFPLRGGLSTRALQPPVDLGSWMAGLLLEENWPSVNIRGPFAGGRPSRSSLSMLLLRERYGDGSDVSALRGIRCGGVGG